MLSSWASSRNGFSIKSKAPAFIVAIASGIVPPDARVIPCVQPLTAAKLTAEPWSLTSLLEKLIKISAKVVSHGRYVTFQMAEVAVPRQMFAEILSPIARLQAPPAPA